MLSYEWSFGFRRFSFNYTKDKTVFQYIFFSFFSFSVSFSSLLPFYFSRGSSRKRYMRIRIYSYLQKRTFLKVVATTIKFRLSYFLQFLVLHVLNIHWVGRGGRKRRPEVQICILSVGWLVCYPVSWLVRLCPSIVGCRSFIPIRTVSRLSSSWSSNICPSQCALSWWL